MADTVPMTCDKVWNKWLGEKNEAVKNAQGVDTAVLKSADAHVKPPPEEALSLAKPGGAYDWIRKLRNRITDRLRAWNGHEYPVVDTDLFVSAYTFANGMYPRKAIDTKPQGGNPVDTEPKLAVESLMLHSPVKIEPKGPASLDPDEIYKELNDACDNVETFLPRLEDHLDSSYNLQVKIAGLEKILADRKALIGKKGEQYKYAIGGDYPQLVRVDGKAVIQMKPGYWPDIEDLEIKIKKLKSGYQSSKITLWRLGLDQALAIKHIETYRQEIQRAKVENGDLEPGGKYKDLWDRMNKLFIAPADAPSGYLVKDEYRAPFIHWDAIQKKEFVNELKSLTVAEQAMFKKILGEAHFQELAKALSPEDRKALFGGRDPFAGDDGFIASYKWRRIFSLVGPPGAALLTKGVWSGYQTWQEAYMNPLKERQKCAEADDDDFFPCVQRYVRAHFPKEFSEAQKDMRVLYDNQDQITDPKFRAAMQDLRQRRENFYAERLAQRVAMFPLRKLYSEDNLWEDAGRKNTIRIQDDKAFQSRLLNDHFKDPGDPAHPRIGYLMFRYRGLYSQPGIRALVQQYVRDRKSNPKRSELALKTLEGMDSTKDLAMDLKNIIEKRDEFLKNPNAPEEPAEKPDP